MVIFVTGKAGAGKTTYASRLAEELLAAGHKVRMLDGDDIRKVNKDQDFSDAGRQTHLLNMARNAGHSERLGFTVIVAAIAPKAAWRREMRAAWQESTMVYLPGGTLWEGTEYERPEFDEF